MDPDTEAGRNYVKGAYIRAYAYYYKSFVWEYYKNPKDDFHADLKKEMEKALNALEGYSKIINFMAEAIIERAYDSERFERNYF